jgi:hypothetical protein
VRIADCCAFGAAAAAAVVRLDFDAETDADTATDAVAAWEVTLGTLADDVPAPFELPLRELVDAE